MVTDKVLEKRKEKLQAAIKEMGSGKHKIACFLKGKKIKGIPNSYSTCPIANYVGKIFKKTCLYVDVDASNVSVSFHDCDEGIVVDVSKAVSSFINAFDEGEYPFLEEKE